MGGLRHGLYPGRLLLIAAAIAMMAILPTAPAEAKPGASASIDHSSVDVFGEWLVSGNSSAETVDLHRWATTFDPSSAGWGWHSSIEPPLPTPSFGFSVAVGRRVDRTDPIVAVGAPDAASVFLYEFVGNSLQLLTTVASPVGADAFGASVDMSGDILIVGAPQAHGGTGSAYRYQVGSGVMAELVVPDPDAGSEIGSVVAVEGNRAWVAMPGHNLDIGAVAEFDVDTALITAVITPATPVTEMRFGTSLSADPGRVLIGGAGLTSAFLQSGITQTEIASPTASVIADVALEGNLIALDSATSGAPVEVLSDNGSTGVFGPFDSIAAITDVKEIVLGGGWLFTAQTPGFDPARPDRVLAPIVIADSVATNKIVPHLGWQTTKYGSRVDVSGDTLVAVRGSGSAPAQIVVSQRSAVPLWSSSSWDAVQFIDLAGPVAGAIAIEGDVVVASIGDAGDPSNPNVVVLQRPDSTAPFAINASFRTQSGAPPRSVAIDPTGEYLALGLPNQGQVEVHSGGPTNWGVAPQVLDPNDAQGTGAATFGWDLDFGDGFLLIGKPGTTVLASPAEVAGVAEQWRVDPAGFTWFGDRTPGNSVPGDAAGWTVEIETDLRVVGSPLLGTVQVWRSGAGDSLLTDPSPAPGDAYWGYAMDLDSGVLVVNDWAADTVAFDLYSPGMSILDTFAPADLEAGDAEFATFPLATSDGTTMVGARLEDFQGRDAGAVYTFSVVPSDPPGPTPRDWPTVVQVDDATAVIGNPANDLVHVVRYDGTDWVETQQLTGTTDSSFGAGLALEGDVLIVGAPDADDRLGTITRFARGGDGLFVETATSSYSAATATDEFGAHLDVNANWVIAGAPEESAGSSGTAVIFDQSLAGEARLLATEFDSDAYGASVALGRDSVNGVMVDLAWVGAPDAASTAGTIWGYGVIGGAWAGTGTATGTAAGDHYGSALESNGLSLAFTAGAGESGFASTSQWDLTGQVTGPTTVFSGAVADIVYNGDLIAIGTTDSQVQLFSDNGTTGLYMPFGQGAGQFTGSSIDVDGDWIVAGVAGGLSTDWTQHVDIQPVSNIAAQPNTPANKIAPEFGTDAGRFGSTVVSNDDVFVVASPADPSHLAQARVTIYDLATRAAIQQIADVTVAAGRASSLALDGDRLMIGHLDTVEVFERAGAGSPFISTGDILAASAVSSIDLDADTVAIGQADLDQVTVYDLVGGVWTAAAGSPLTAQFASAGDQVGFSVAVNGNVVVAGAPNDNQGLPGTSVVAWSRPDAATAFVEQPRLRHDESSPGQIDRFGHSIDFDGAHLVVGAPWQDFNGGGGDGLGTGFRLGTVHVFDHLGEGSFGNIRTLRPDLDMASSDSESEWGTSVSLHDDTLVAGGSAWAGDDDREGAVVAYRFDTGANAWLVTPFIASNGTAADGEPGDGLGSSVTLSGTTVIAGAPAEDSSGLDAGVAYHFDLSQPPPPPPTHDWLPVVDLDNGAAAIGNPAEGVVHIVEHDGAGWTEVQQILGSAADGWGAGVAIEGDRLYVGAPEADGGIGQVTGFVRGSDGLFGVGTTVGFTEATADDDFGTVLDVTGPWVIAGAPVPGQSGTAVIWDLDLDAEAAVLSTPSTTDEFGASVAVAMAASRVYSGDDTTPARQLAWVGAPSADDPDGEATGQIYGWWFDGSAWVQTGFGQANLQPGERRGDALASTSGRVLSTGPGRGATGQMRESSWNDQGFVSGRDPWTTTSVADGDIDLNGHQYAVGAPSASEIHLLSDNDNGRTPDLVAVYSSPATGRSLAVDGDWLIGATDAASADWTDLAEIVQISTLGVHPSVPDNKVQAPFGSDYNRFGQIVDSTTDTWVSVAPSWRAGNAPNSIHVYDSATGDLIQRIVEPTVDVPITDVALDENRLAVVTVDAVQVWERPSPEEPYGATPEVIAIVDGFSVDLDGDLLAVGRPATNEVLPFAYDGATWQPVAPLTTTLSETNDGVGYDVAVFSDQTDEAGGDIIVAGAPVTAFRNRDGYAAVWTRPDSDSPFTEQERVVSAPLSVARDKFGASVDFDGEFLVVGSPEELVPAVSNADNPGNPGAVSIFGYLGDGRFGPGRLIYPKADIDGGHGNSAWGHSVDLLDGFVAIGGPGFAPSIGFDGYYAGGVAVYQYEPVAGHWELTEFVEGQHHPGDPQRWDYLGIDVAMVDVAGTPTVVAGKPQDDASGIDSGSAYTFEVIPVVRPPIENKIVSLTDADLVDGTTGDLFGFSIDTDGSRLVIGAPESASLPAPIGDVGVGGSGGVFVFERVRDLWVFDRFIDLADGAGPAVEFGAAVAIDGDLVAIGAPRTDGSHGTAYVYDLGTDELTEIPIAGLSTSALQGQAIDIDATTGPNPVVVIGSPNHAPTLEGVAMVMAGRVDVFELTDGTWSRVWTYTSWLEGTQVGRSVSIDGDTIAIGTLDNTHAGFVQVARRGGPNTYNLDPVIEAPTGSIQFGLAVDLDGDNLAIGSPTEDAAYLHTWNGTTWGTGIRLEAASPRPGADFGMSVSLEGTLAVVGEPVDEIGGGGAVHVFGNTGIDEWTLLQDYAAVDGAAYDRLGWAVDVTATGAVIAGAPFDDNPNGVDAGAAYTLAVTPPPVPEPPTDPVTVSAVDYALPTSVMPGATSVTIEGTSVATTGSDTTSSGGIVAASVGDIDLDTEVDGEPIPLGNLTLGDLGIDADGLALDALMQVPLSEFPVEGGWAQYLPPEYDGVPLQSITLGDIWNLSTVQSIPLRFTEIEASPLRFTDIAVIAFGTIDLLSIDLDGDPGTAPLDEWCDVLLSVGSSCADLGIVADSATTLGTISAAGVNLEATPLRFTPLRFTYVEASPLRFTPLRFTDIEASPLRFTPLRFTDIEASPLRFTPLRFTPLRFTPLRFTPLRFTPLRFTDISATPLRFTPLRFTANPDAIADCALIDCTDETLTLGDVADGGALRDGFTIEDLGDAVLSDLRFEDILAGLSQESIDALHAVLQDQSLTLADLFSEFGIDGIGDMTLGDIDPEAFSAVAELLSYTIGDFLSSLPEDVLDDYTLADFLLLFLPREAYQWDDVDLGSVNLQLAGMSAPLSASVAFTTLDGPTTSTVTVAIDLPAGAVVHEGSFTVSPTSATITGTTLTDTAASIGIANVAPGVEHTISFGLYQGLDLGTSTSHATVTAGSSSLTATGTISVLEAFEPENDTLAGSVPVLADNLYLSHVGTSGDRDFFRLTVTEPATTVSVQLANLAADYDLVVYGPRIGSIIPTDGSTAASAPDADFDASGSGGTLSPVPLNDLPTSIDELQVYGASYFRGTDAEQVDFLAIEPGDFYVQVSGYLGASAPQPYSLRAAATSSVTLPCPARSFAFSGAAPGTASSVSGSANTLVLLNRSRLEGFFGPTEASSIVDAAERLVASVNANAIDGVEAAIVDLDAFADIQAAYDGWDSSPCSSIAVNNVVSAIANAVLGIRSSQRIDHVLIVGGDDIVPFGRVADATTIANEQSYTNTFTAAEDNALRSAFAGSWILSDDPYGDRAPTAIANTDRVVYVPEIGLGRLVESPTEIVGAIDQYIAFDGQLDPQTGFVAGYDFLDDGAVETGDNLDEAISPATVQRLINETWTAAELNSGLAAGPDLTLIAAHFDHANALPAAGNLSHDTSDLFDVTDAAALDFSGSVLFSVGCHGGLSVSDLLIAPTGVVSTDWAQTFLAQGAAAFVGNTGYGYGDDTAVALSEKLMAEFAAGLGDYETVGEALLYAKQGYASDLTVYGAFDEKALMEATLYGIPFYRLGNTVVPRPVPEPPTEPAPTGSVSYTDTFDPVLEVAGDGTEDEVWSTPGDDGEDQVQVTNGYPILPRFEFEVTQQDPADPQQLELEARGVVLESLVTRDEINVDPATARAVYDLAANEPNVDASDVTFALTPAITTYLTPEGTRQNVNMTVGAFQSTEADGSGTMRLFEQFEATVYYTDDAAAEKTKPTITDVAANSAGGVLNLAVDVYDASPIVRVTALVSSTPLPNVVTTWQLVELEASGGLWQGSAPLTGDSFQWLIMAVDTHGNSGWSMSKQLAFDGEGQGLAAPILINPVAPAEPVLAGEPINLEVDLWDFDGSDDAISVVWDFGDGSTCTVGSGGDCEIIAPTDVDPFGSTSATHDYDQAGAYQVLVTATDSFGLTTTITMGPVVVASETTTGWTVANGQGVPLGPDDILPDGVDGKKLKVNVTAGYAEHLAEFAVRFTAHKIFDFRGGSFDYVDVVGDTAIVVGSGTINPETDSPTPVIYRVIVDDRANMVTLEIWPEGSDINTTTPLYRITVKLKKRNAIKVRPS